MDPLLEDRAGGTRLWAVDKVILAYVAFTTVLLLGWWQAVPESGVLLAGHMAGIALLLFEIKRPNPTSRLFRYWYPLFYVGACYKEMAILIPPIRKEARSMAIRSGRSAMGRPSHRMAGAHPDPLLTETLQIIYTLFVPAVLLVAFLLWYQARYREFQFYAFLIALGYLVSYVGYLLVPARGPRFLLQNLQHAPLQGIVVISHHAEHFRQA